MKKQLVQIHSQTPQLIHCACCDGASIEVCVFYKAIEENNQLSFNSYLECCKDQVGEVVDWYNLEDYKKVVGKYKFYGGVVNEIQGYQKK